MGSQAIESLVRASGGRPDGRRPSGRPTGAGGIGLRRPTARDAIVAMAVVLAATLLLASSASAALSRPFTNTSFGPDGVGGTESFTGVVGIAVDQAKGFVYVYSEGRVYKFDTSGKPLPFGAGPGNVIEGVEGGRDAAQFQIAVAPPNSPGGTAGDIYVANGSQLKIYSEAGEELGTLRAGGTCGVAVSPTTGHLIVGNSKETITEYVPAANPPTERDLVATGKAEVFLCNVGADGLNGIYAARFNGGEDARLEGIADSQPTLIKPGGRTIFVDPESNDLYANRGEVVTIYDPTGAKIGEFANRQIVESYGVAVSDSTQQAYVSDGAGKVKIFGSLVTIADAETEAATAVLPVGATLNGTVSPKGLPLKRCFFEYGKKGFENEVECSAPKAGEISPTGEKVPVHATVQKLEPRTSYQFRLVTENANGISEGETATVVTPGPVVTEPASVSAESVTLNGEVFPAGAPVSACKFEYGLSDHAGFEGSQECNPPAGSIPASNGFQAVTAKLTGLKKEARYRFRLVATTTEGADTGEALGFETFGRPGISEPRAGDADQSSVTLEATVNPRGSATAYSFQWGQTTGYGQVAPVESAAPYGAAGLVVIKARLTGLAAATAYHFRVVASNSAGTSESADAELETLDSCGLPDDRCFELVSERDSGAVARPAEPAGNIELHFQSSTQPGDFAYVAEGGFPDATKGSEVLYRALRGPEGWTSHQLSAPLLVQNQVKGGSAHSGEYKLLSETLSCGVLASNQPLTSDAATRFATETGGLNFYRDNMDGTYTTISFIPPENPEAVEDTVGAFTVDGTSSNCDKVVFESPYKYESVPGLGYSPAYEWEDGKLRSVGFVPGRNGGEVPVEVSSVGAVYNGVSEDGSRVFFTARRDASPLEAEREQRGIFVRENGNVTRDISLSETTTPDLEPKFELATKDGSRVFFLATAGLTTETSSEGTDLYEYDFASERLVDLSIDEEAGGAEVVGLIGASEDGSRVYFVARGELASGQGKSFAENKRDDTYSVYTEVGGQITYVGSLLASYPRTTSLGFPSEEKLTDRVINGEQQTAQVSADGRYLVFESAEPLTGYEAGNGITEAYLFDAGAAGEPLRCLSCRPDGKPSLQPRGNRFLVAGGLTANSTERPRSLAVRNGKPEVFFTAFDPLAPGAVEGLGSNYEWAHGQIYHFTSEPPGLQPSEHYEGAIRQATSNLGASADGTDTYFVDPKKLTWEDEDERYSIYDARVGGGFPEPPAPPAPCDPAAEDSCQGAAAPPSGSSPASPTGSFHGPGNAKPKKHHKKHHKKKHRRHKKKHHDRSKARRHHGSDRGGDRHHGHVSSDRGHGK